MKYIGQSATNQIDSKIVDLLWSEVVEMFVSKTSL